MTGLIGHRGLMLGGDEKFPYWANVISQHNWLGADGSTVFTDDTGKVWTGYGNTQIDTTYGPGCLVDGAGDYLTTSNHVDFYLTTALFTVEGFFRESVRGPLRQILGQHTTVNGGTSSFILLSDNGKLTFQVFIGATYYTIANPAQHAIDTIHHYACVRDSGNVFRLYLNGVQVASLTQAGALNSSGQALCKGTIMRGGSPDPVNYFFTGVFLARRMLKGVCLYPGGTTFAVPSTPFPTS